MLNVEKNYKGENNILNENRDIFISAATNRGKTRSHNEDRFFIDSMGIFQDESKIANILTHSQIYYGYVSKQFIEITERYGNG